MSRLLSMLAGASGTTGFTALRDALYAPYGGGNPIDPTMYGSTSASGLFQSRSTAPNFTGYYRTILAGNGKIYFMPYSADNVAEFDPLTGSLTTFGQGQFPTGSNIDYAAAALAPNGCIYVLPARGSFILKVDIRGRSVTTIGAGMGTSQYGKFFDCAITPGGIIYAAQYYWTSNLSKVIRINTNNDTYSFLDGQNFGLGSTSASYYFSAVLAPNGMIYCAPYLQSNYNILVINPSNNGLSRITPPSTSPDGFLWEQAVLAPNGRIYAVPFSKSTRVLEINPENNTATTIGNILSSTGTYGWSTAVMGANGKIYGFSGYDTRPIEIDPVSRTTSLLPSQPFTMGAPVLYPDGKIHTFGTNPCTIGGGSNPFPAWYLNQSYNK